MKNRVLQTNVFQFYLLFEEKPVCDIDLDGSGVQESVLFLVFHQHAFEKHAIEQREIHMLDPYLGIQVMGDPVGDLANEEILNGGGLYEQPY